MCKGERERDVCGTKNGPAATERESERKETYSLELLLIVVVETIISIVTLPLVIGTTIQEFVGLGISGPLERWFYSIVVANRSVVVTYFMFYIVAVRA